MEALPIISTPSKLSKEGKVNEKYVVDEIDEAKVAHNEFSDDIPVISLAGIDEDNRRSEVLRQVVAAAKEWGMFQVVDHGVDHQLMSMMSTLSKEFFAFPDEEKLTYQGSLAVRGGLIISTHLDEERVANWREFMLFCTYPEHSRDYSKWPDKPKEWKRIVEVYAKKQMELSLTLIDILSQGMGVEASALALGEPIQNLVVNYYPKCPQPKLAMGLKQHTDRGCITILFQDNVGGLQVTKDNGKSWITLRPIQNALVVILGEHMKYMSNGRFKSAEHRAITNANNSRVTVVAFLEPASEAMLYPLKIGKGEKSLLEKPIAFSEMVERHYNRLLEIEGLKKLAKEENWSQDTLHSKLDQLN